MVASTITELLARIEGYGFECAAGPLILCRDWQKLRALAEREQRLRAGIEDALRAGTWPDCLAQLHAALPQSPAGGAESEWDEIHASLDAIEEKLDDYEQATEKALDAAFAALGIAQESDDGR